MIAQRQPVTTAKRVADNHRLAFLPKIFGPRAFIGGESLVYSLAKRLSESYNGGYRDFYSLSGGSGYLAPTAPDAFDVSLRSNGFEGRMGADTFGMVVTLFALNQLAFDAAHRGDDQSSEFFVDQYHKLRDYALDQSEGALVARAID